MPNATVPSCAVACRKLSKKDQPVLPVLWLQEGALKFDEMTPSICVQSPVQENAQESAGANS